MSASVTSIGTQDDAEPDLFRSETDALEHARSILALTEADAPIYQQALGDLTAHFERLMRETRRLIRRSDRAEREMNTLNSQLQTLARQLEYRATHDALTDVLNRGAIIDLTVQALQKTGAAMVVLDIDHFKQINDEFGHPAGDAVIQGIVGCLRRAVGNAGFIGRVGGEEFTVLIPAGTLEEGLDLAESLRDSIASHVFGQPVNRQITASFGVSASPVGTNFDSAYGLADAALYQAKRSGRNRVEAARAEADASPL
ncbi:GGDEF domain-containing protein [Pseudomonas gingeri]|uniref:diguanylate cyclase n=1 Tax=Pseudomonas gingeri TaxID=117681 RepID=A0A7Y7X968_9PSED|nr:GGDEF domain-containing protein [Pseudomonas gingeri]NWA25997.1 GGDEF domain-containing protein [Pseudomonas gingeri]NWB95350.1 GGDEF domain-containing protein [Pseudomonas gingeri]NWD67513.1 GGDEF domain-containing protein [Pseudomonas gingeri]NWD74328.1 GGDEF domain-containing protein [Pseudomonas gingeri]